MATCGTVLLRFSPAEVIRIQGCLLVRSQHGSLCLLNETAAWLWQTFCDSESMPEAVERYARRFALADTEAEAAVEQTVRDWEAEHLVERVSAEVGPAAQGPAVLDAVYRIGGRPLRVRCRVAGVAQWIENVFGPARQRQAGEAVAHLELDQRANCFILMRNDLVVFQDPDSGYVRGALVREMLRLGWPGLRWSACLHAAAVGNGSSCLVLAGACGAGKSTLAAAMVQVGFTFMCDDVVPLEGGGWRVWPLPVAMSLKEQSWAAVGERFAGFTDLPVYETERGRVRYLVPSATTQDGLPVHALIFPTYQPGEPVSLKRVTPVDALSRLFVSGSSLDLSGHDLRHTVEWLETTPAYQIVYADLDAAVARLRQLWHRRGCC